MSSYSKKRYNVENWFCKASIIMGLLILLTLKSEAQQDPLYSNYVFNPLTFNPAYAGSSEALSFVFLHRSQWTGFKGAPTTNTITIHAPIPKYDLGVGLTLIQDELGPLKQTGVSADFAYKVKVNDRSELSFGLKTTINSYTANFDDLYVNDQESNGMEMGTSNNVRFNTGAGLYYSHEKYYVGLSLPKLIHNNISDGNGNSLPKEKGDLFINGGYVFEIHPGFQFKPTTLLRLVNGAPPSVDIGVNFFFFEKIGAGVYNRLGDSFGMLFNYWFSNQLRIGYSYDYSISLLSDYNNGSHEIVVTYDLYYKNSKVKSPRYF